jgi:zinc-finger of transposase IS204/IS1001/IS1096/IS1165
MGQRARILTQIAGFRGWNVATATWETAAGVPFTPVAGYDVPAGAVLLLRLERRWTARCSNCQAILTAKRLHQHGQVRRWDDLPWAGHPVVLEYAPDRYKCPRCKRAVTEARS